MFEIHHLNTVLRRFWNYITVETRISGHLGGKSESVPLRESAPVFDFYVHMSRIVHKEQCITASLARMCQSKLIIQDLKIAVLSSRPSIGSDKSGSLTCQRPWVLSNFHWALWEEPFPFLPSMMCKTEVKHGFCCPSIHDHDHFDERFRSLLLVDESNLVTIVDVGKTVCRNNRYVVVLLSSCSQSLDFLRQLRQTNTCRWFHYDESSIRYLEIGMPLFSGYLLANDRSTCMGVVTAMPLSLARCRNFSISFSISEKITRFFLCLRSHPLESFDRASILVDLDHFSLSFVPFPILNFSAQVRSDSPSSRYSRGPEFTFFWSAVSWEWDDIPMEKQLQRK